MAYRIAIDELGVVDDHTTIEGATPGDVWRGVSEHLKDKHQIKIPDLDDMGGEAIFPAVTRFDNSIVGGQQGPVIAKASHLVTGVDSDEQARLIVTRLLEKLNVGQQGSGGSDIVPPGGTQSPMP